MADPLEAFSAGFTNGFDNAKERKLKMLMAQTMSPYQKGALANDQAQIDLARQKMSIEQQLADLQKYKILHPDAPDKTQQIEALVKMGYPRDEAIKRVYGADLSQLLTGGAIPGMTPNQPQMLAPNWYQQLQMLKQSQMAGTQPPYGAKP